MPFVKGQSGNPGGNPGGKHGDKLFRIALLAALKKVDGDAEKIQRVADKLVENAIDGDTTAIREIADRLDGKPAQAIDVSGDDRRIIVEIRRFDDPPTIDATVNQVVSDSVVLAAAAETPSPPALAAISPDDDLELPPILDRRAKP
jgi:hypothetical protein